MKLLDFLYQTATVLVHPCDQAFRLRFVQGLCMELEAALQGKQAAEDELGRLRQKAAEVAHKLQTTGDCFFHIRHATAETAGDQTGA